MPVLRELQSLLQRPAGPTAGVVVALDEQSVSVATRAGTQILRRVDATAYAIGDRVRIRSGAPAGRLIISPRRYIV